MKKKILFVTKSYQTGGIQSSMINMIKEIQNDYDIDIFTYNDQGAFKDRIRELKVNIIKSSYLMKIVGMDMSDAKKTKNIFTIAIRGLMALWCKFFGNSFPLKLAFSTQKKLGPYDVSIAYHHETPVDDLVSGFYRFIHNKTDAKLKLGWIHYDANCLLHLAKNEKHMDLMDKIVCVSNGVKDAFLNVHPVFKNKVEVCYNFQDILSIIKKSNEPQKFQYDKNCFNCISACRFSFEKDIPRAVLAFGDILKKHKNVRWYIAGDGNDMPRVKEMLKEYNLENEIILLGNQSNPYPYIKNADLFILPSQNEAAPMVYGEAMILKTPIFSTETTSVRELLSGADIGYVCENNMEDMKKSFDYLLSNREVIKGYNENYKNFTYTNDKCKEQFEKLIKLSDEK